MASGSRVLGGVWVKTVVGVGTCVCGESGNQDKTDPEPTEQFDSSLHRGNAFEEVYWNPNVSSFGDGSQAPQVFALYLGGLAPEREKAEPGNSQTRPKYSGRTRQGS